MPFRPCMLPPPQAAGLIAGLALVAVHATASPAPLGAQSPASPTVEEATPTTVGAEATGPNPLWRDGTWKPGISLGSPLVGWRPVAFAITIGVHAQQFPRGRVGFEGSLGTVPTAAVVGDLVVGGRGGVTMPVRTDSLLLLPSAGVSFVAIPNLSNPVPVSGFYAGLATVSPRGLRVGVTLHLLHETGRFSTTKRLVGWPVWLVEVGGLRL